MNFSELVEKVCEEVERPDFTFKQDGGTGDAVNAVLGAILTLHMRELYWRDIVPVQAVFDAAAYIQSVDLSLLPKFRRMAYVRKWDPTQQASQINPTTQPPASATSLNMLQEITPDNIFDMYGYEKSNVWYAAGDTLFLRSNTALQYALIGYYAQPAIIPGTDNRYSATMTWIMDIYPYAIIYNAASKLFVTIGQQDTSRKYDRPASRGDEGGLVQQQISIIDRDNITAG